MIICIWPSGIRTAPWVALKIPKPWNAQSPSHSLCFQAEPLRISLSVSLCVTQRCHHHPSTAHTETQKGCVLMHGWWWCLWALVRVNQCVSLCCTPLADRWKPQAQCWGSVFWSSLPPAHPANHPSLLSRLSPQPSTHPLPLHPPPTPLQPFAPTKQKEKLQSYAGSPQNLAAGSGSLPLLLCRDKSSSAFDKITQTE